MNSEAISNQSHVTGSRLIAIKFHLIHIQVKAKAILVHLAKNGQLVEFLDYIAVLT